MMVKGTADTLLAALVPPNLVAKSAAHVASTMVGMKEKTREATNTFLSPSEPRPCQPGLMALD